MPHVIRLRGPWHYQIVESGCAEPAAAGKVQMPTDWSDTLGSGFCGRVKCTRHFGMPTGLDEHSIVMLVISPTDACGRIALNGECLSEPQHSDSPAHFDIGDRLLPRNELCIELELPTEGGPSCDVRLELSTHE